MLVITAHAYLKGTKFCCLALEKFSLKQWVGNTGICEGISEGISTAKQTNI